MFPLDAYAQGTGCVNQKHIANWNNLSQLEAHGFLVDLESPQAALGFGQGSHHGTLQLDLDTTPNFAGETVASRVTQIDTSVPPAQRVKCWQPTTSKDVVANFTAHFDQAEPPFGLTETMFLWNAPFGSDPIPLTAIGVTRSLDLTTGQPEYSAIVAQDLVFDPRSLAFLRLSQCQHGWMI